MAQLSTVLSNNHLLEGAQGGPRYSTTVYAGSTGKESRNMWWATPRHYWTLTFAGYLADVQPVIDLVQEANGMGLSFRWAPPGYVEADFRLDTDEPDITVEAGGVTRVSFSVIQVIGE